MLRDKLEQHAKYLKTYNFVNEWGEWIYPHIAYDIYSDYDKAIIRLYIQYTSVPLDPLRCPIYQSLNPLTRNLDYE